MGWSNSHDTTYRSATLMHEASRHVSYVVSAGDWRTVRNLFQFANTGDGPFQIPHRDAGRMAGVLRKAAGHPKMPVSFQGPIRELADAAQRAASARQSWEWS